MDKTKLTKKEKALIERLHHAVAKTIGLFDLIQENDSILIGLSGGKDSLILTEILANRLRYSAVKYSIIAAHIKVREVSYEIDSNYLRKFCESLNITFIYKEVSLTKEIMDNNPCFPCSWSRRKELFAIARENNCNKIATGHHADDALETMLMNMAMHGRISSIPACFPLFDGEIMFIRPLIQIFEDKLRQYSQIKQYPSLKQPCPFDHLTRRKQFRAIIDSIEDLHSGSKINMYNSMSNLIKEYIPFHRTFIKEVDTKFKLDN